MAKFQPIFFGKYLLLDKLATGGMAELYRAKLTGEKGFEKLVAIKKILPHLNQEQDLIAAFIDEAKLAALLQHQNIVQIYDFGSIEETYFLAMEYLFGKDLRAITAKSKEKNLPLPVEHALFIISCVCAGLDYSHKLSDFQGNPLNLIHRDISPQNVLITHEGEVKIVDFGIAKAASKSSLTETGIIKGKVAYMSPEQAAGAIIDHRSDIFSTGILLYEMVTGRRMFHGDTLQVLARVRDAKYDPPETYTTDAPAALYQILNRALARSPDKRYQSCGEMLTDIDACLAHFSLRPNALALSKHMKSLFADEITTETRLLRDLTRIIHPGESTARKGWTERIKQSRIWGGGAAAFNWLRGPLREKAVATLSRVWVRTRQRPLLWVGAPAGAVLAAVLIIVALSHRTPVVSTNSADHGKGALSTGIPAGKSAKVDRAMQALDKKQFAQAVKLFEEALATEPSYKEMVAAPYAQALRGQGSALIKTQPQKAKIFLEKAVQMDPQNSDSHFQMGVLSVKLKDYPTAIKAYKKAAELAPNSADTFFNLGFVYAVTRDYANAEKMFSRVIELKPRYLDEAYFNLAMVQKKQVKDKQCIENLEQAIAVNPKNQKARKYLDLFKGKSGETQ
jgi:serine/threonine protein kinase/Tfp pilus assembly protein PilF